MPPLKTVTFNTTVCFINNERGRKGAAETVREALECAAYLIAQGDEPRDMTPGGHAPCPDCEHRIDCPHSQYDPAEPPNYVMEDMMGWHWSARGGR